MRQIRYWVEAANDKGTFGADSHYNWKEAVTAYQVLKAEATEQGYTRVCIWENRRDGEWGDQPNYAVDPLAMWMVS